MFEKTEGVIQNGQFRDTGTIEHKTQNEIIKLENIKVIERNILVSKIITDRLLTNITQYTNYSF
jgi:hypothetical protein